MTEINLEYYRASYRKVYDNFLFSADVYCADKMLLKQLCIEALKKLDALNKQFMEMDKVSTYFLLVPYQRAIKRFYLDL